MACPYSGLFIFNHAGKKSAREKVNYFWAQTDGTKDGRLATWYQRLVDEYKDQRPSFGCCRNFPSGATETSLTPFGKAVVVILPPGQRIQISVGGSGVASTWMRLSCDQ